MRVHPQSCFRRMALATVQEVGMLVPVTAVVQVLMRGLCPAVVREKQV